MTRGRRSVTTRPALGWPATWPGRTMVGGGSLLGLAGLTAVSPVLAVTVTITAALVIITALVTQALPEIIAARSLARTAKQACDNPQAERTLRILKGPEYLSAKTEPTSVTGRIVGSPPEATSATTAKTTSGPEPGSKTLREVPPAVRKLAA
jgi:hypothetical protein